MISQSYRYNDMLNQFEKADKKAKELVKNVDNKLLLQRPSPDRWSSAECIQHLVQFGDIYYDKINRRSERVETGESFSEAVFKPRFHFKIINKYMEPPYSFKVKPSPLLNLQM